MQPLFASAPRIDPAEILLPSQAAKCAAVQLQSSPSAWVDEILEVALREHPYLPADRLVVNFRDKQEAQGNAVGYLSISGSPRLSIPIIIRNRQLSPIDVLIIRRDGDQSPDGQVMNTQGQEEDDVVPLTEQTFTQQAPEVDVGDIVQDSQTYGSGWSEDGSQLRLPIRGRTVLASAIGVTREKKAALQTALQADKASLAGFAAYRTGDVIESWLNAPDPADSFRHKLAAVQVPVATIRRLGAEPVAMKVAEMQVVTADMQLLHACPVECFDLFSTKVSTILVFEDGRYCDAPEVVCGIPMEKAAHLDALAATTLHRGDTVMLRTAETALCPVKIARIFAEGDLIRLTVTDGLSEREIVLADQIKVATLSNGQWFVPLDSTTVYTLRPETIEAASEAKVASYLQQLMPSMLIHNQGGWTLRVNGDDFGVSDDSAEKCAAVLSQWFVGGEQLMADALANPRGIARFACDLDEAVKTAVKVAESYHALPGSVAEFLAGYVLPLDKAVKLAASIADASGSDAVLCSGMVSEDNLLELVNLVPTLRDVIGRLARLLLYIRLGYPAGDETSTMVAMRALQRVADRLEAMKTEMTVS